MVVVASRGETVVTLLWFFVWFLADNIGSSEPLRLEPVNGWTATLILAVALDLGSSHAWRSHRR